MTNIKKKLIFVLFLSAMLLTTMTATVFANNIKVTIDGKEVIFDQPPINQNGRVLVPIRPIAEALNCTVTYYDDFPTTTTIYTNNVEERGKSCQIYWGEHNTDLTVTSYFHKPPKEVKLDPKPQVINGRTMFGLRNLADIMNVNVEWIDDTNTVEITTNNMI